MKTLRPRPLNLSFRGILLLLFLALACNLPGSDDSIESDIADENDGETVKLPDNEQEEEDEDDLPEQVEPEDRPPVVVGDVNTKWDLWSSGKTLLRGANIWQSLVIPDLDGLEFKGAGHIGPPYTQEDFNNLARLGANYVTISGAGIFTEKPPFEVDQQAVEHLDTLLDMIANADMFATIGFRTGPGRSEYTLCCGGDPYFDGYFNDTMWEDQVTQDAWVEMWRYTAEYFADNPIVVGYKLMVEPNAAAVFFEYYDPEEFYPAYAGTLYDWNQLFPRIVSAIREVDTETPILVNAEGFSAVEWLPYLQVVDEVGVVYIAHHYEPFEDYTHQEPGGRNSYPGSFDLDYDGESDDFDREWLMDVLSPLVEFSDSYGVPVGLDEFGVNRWVLGGDIYMDDIMGLFEDMGINYSLWEWQTTWPDFEMDVHDMNFRFGPDPENLTSVPNELLTIIEYYWSLNLLRPSNAPWAIDN
ncbi:MAG: cellulase family glycosylhydrolase [Chloroflexi bacterium]|nr:cellulase family glycosylhydrolase [Chloroflexota bacterium]